MKNSAGYPIFRNFFWFGAVEAPPPQATARSHAPLVLVMQISFCCKCLKGDALTYRYWKSQFVCCKSFIILNPTHWFMNFIKLSSVADERHYGVKLPVLLKNFNKQEFVSMFKRK